MTLRVSVFFFGLFLLAMAGWVAANAAGGNGPAVGRNQARPRSNRCRSPCSS